ncbi:hypothetical protein BTA51_11225 [Hahella sp. CCB-MM4]|uniref:hypothetical protein n=1 Tax=Hahella sp. (strain CCB-MM4) TaxID=1926491 RepID=UPI000BC39D80|nr:hypothetical protein [Hahella sp. CCB-MM4]OZG73601.1 hypothetical protein BTA51_11225 [Hahella sp. CCB-MM4]
MKFKELFFSKEKFFSVGIEEDSGGYYLAIPVSNSRVDYEEYYKLDRDIFDSHKHNLAELEYIAEECRMRKRDNDLYMAPGADRGVPL